MHSKGGRGLEGPRQVDEYAIAQTRSDDTDQFALGIFVDTGKGSPVIAKSTKRGKLLTKFGSVFCNDGDVVLAVSWLVRDESDAERRTFYDPSDEDECGSCQLHGAAACRLRVDCARAEHSHGVHC